MASLFLLFLVLSLADLPGLAPSSSSSSADAADALDFSALGPMVINKDGSLGRIANWHGLTPHERVALLRTLNARNQLRKAQLEDKDL